MRLRDSIHGVASRSREDRLQLLCLFGGSHDASSLRWRGSFRGSFGRSFAAICFLFLYCLYPCVQRLQLGMLHFLPPLLAFVTACVRKPSLPRNGAWHASCPSRVLRIPEGHCELVVLSVWNERPLLRCIDILLKPRDGSLSCSFVQMNFPDTRSNVPPTLKNQVRQRSGQFNVSGSTPLSTRSFSALAHNGRALR